MNTLDSVIPRSYLFVPGDRPERFIKAANSGAHRVVLDLEDAVSMQNKDVARDSVINWLKQGNKAVVRINDVNSQYYEKDMALLLGFPNVEIMLPKADKDSVTETCKLIGENRLIVLIEGVRGVLDLEYIARANGVLRLAFGSIDFTFETGIRDVHCNLDYIRNLLVIFSKAYGLHPPIDGVCTEFKDSSEIERQAKISKDLGFGAKLCIHPNQVDITNKIWKPTPVEIEWAKKVIDASATSEGAAISVDGVMVDKPVFDMARQILMSI